MTSPGHRRAPLAAAGFALGLWLGVPVAAPAAASEAPGATTAATSSTIAGGVLAPAPTQPATSTTSTTQPAPVRDDGGMTEEVQIRIAMGGLVAVAVVLAGATLWYARATRPVAPPPGPAEPPAR